MFKNTELKKIMVPWNFSSNSKIALRKALSMSTENTRIILVHVAAPLTSGEYGMIDLMGHTECPYRQRFEQELPQYKLDKRIRFQTEYGYVAGELIRAAKSIKPDVVVVAAREKSRLSKVLFGDVVAKLNTLATCPVMLLKVHDRKNEAVGKTSSIPSPFGEFVST